MGRQTVEVETWVEEVCILRRPRHRDQKIEIFMVHFGKRFVHFVVVIEVAHSDDCLFVKSAIDRRALDNSLLHALREVFAFHVLLFSIWVWASFVCMTIDDCNLHLWVIIIHFLFLQLSYLPRESSYSDDFEERYMIALDLSEVKRVICLAIQSQNWSCLAICGEMCCVSLNSGRYFCIPFTFNIFFWGLFAFVTEMWSLIV